MTVRWRFSRAVAAMVAGLVLTAMQPALAVEPGEMLADSAQEARARALSAKLRCLVCQNQSIDDSNAPLAKDLRLLVRERLTAGDNDDAVLSYIVARYGDFVLLRPPIKGSTLLLWIAPALCLAGIAYALLRMSGRTGARRSVAAQGGAAGLVDGLSGEEERRLAEHLARHDPAGRT